MINGQDVTHIKLGNPLHQDQSIKGQFEFKLVNPFPQH